MPKRILIIGQTVYKFDQNRREYTKPEKGRLWGEPIYAGHFIPLKVVGENEREYLLERNYVVNKRSGLLDGKQFYTEKEKDDNIWVHDNRRDIVRKLESCYDAEILKKVNALLG